MAIEFSYGGVPLLFDQNQHVQKFLDKYQSLDDLVDQVEPTAITSGRTDSRSGNGQLVGLPVPNYPDPPQIRLNQLYWPTGAARWARGYFLADNTRKSEIVGLSQPSSGVESPLTLKMGDLSTSMSLLTPHRVGGTSDSASLWLLPLVDVRYFWQNRNFGTNTTTTGTSWAILISNLGTQLGVTIAADAVDAAYLIPDPEELSRKYDNAAVMLDAAAHSVGMRAVRLLDGTVKLMDWSSSNSQRVLNIGSHLRVSGDGILIAGKEAEPAPAPATVDFVCQKSIEGVAIPDEIHQYSKSPSSGTITSSGTSHAIHSTAYADFSGVTATPTNNSDLNTLAIKAAADFYSSIDNAYEFTYQGINTWEPQGYDDHIIYNFGGESPHSTLKATTYVTSTEAAGIEATTKLTERRERCLWTRIQSAPANFGTEQQLSQDSTITPLFHFQFGKINEASGIASEAKGDMDVWVNDDVDDPSVTTHSVSSPLITIQVYNFETATLVDTSEVFAWFNVRSKRWYAVSTGGSSVRVGKTDGTIPVQSADDPGDGVVSIYSDSGGGTWTDTTENVNAKNFGDSQIASGDWVMVSQSKDDPDFYIAVDLNPAKTGITDNRIVRGDGGTDIQDSDWSIADDDAMSVTTLMTSSDTLSITANLLQGGSAISVNSSADNFVARNLIEVLQTGSTSLLAIGFFVQQDADANSIKIASSATAKAAIFVASPGNTTGHSIHVDDAPAVTTGSLASLQCTSEAISTGRIISGTLVSSGDTITPHTGNLNELTSDRTETRTSSSTNDDFDNLLISRTTTMNGSGGSMDSTGALLKIEKITTETLGTLTDDAVGIEIVLSSRKSSGNFYAIDITNDVAGAGVPGGIDMSSFAVDEPLLEVPLDGAATTDFGTAGQFAVLTSGTTGYAPLFTASRPFAIPSLDGPTIAVDTDMAFNNNATIAANDFSTGILEFYGHEKQGILAMPIAEFSSPTNNFVPTYNSTTREFELQPGGSTAAITDNIIPKGTGASIEDSGWTCTDANGLSAVVTETTASGISYTVNGLTTGDGLSVTSTSADDGSRNIANFVNDNSAAVGCTVLNVQQDADAPAVAIVSLATTDNSVDVTASNTTGHAFEITASSLTTGSALRVYSNSSSASFREVVEMVNDNSSSTTAVVLKIQQDATTGEALSITQSSNNSSDVYAVTVTSNNAGAGVPGGITFASYSIDEPILNVPLDGAGVADFGTAGQFMVNVGGTKGYVPVFTEGRPFNIPSSATGAVSSEGDMVIDQTVTDWTTGVIRVFASGEEQGFLTMPIAQFSSPTDGHVATYDGTADEMQLKAPSGGGLTSFTLAAVDETNYDGVASGDATVTVTTTVEIEAGPMVEVTGDDTGKSIRIEAHQLWGIAQANSGDVSPTADTFTVKLCLNAAGGSPETVAEACRVWSGSTSVSGSASGNNIRSGDVIPVSRMIDGKLSTTAGADSPIGTILMFDDDIEVAAVSQLRAGWVPFTGFDGIFPRGPDAGDKLQSDLTTGGAATHDHGAVTGATAPGIITEIADHINHADHSHTVAQTLRDINTLGTNDSTAGEVTECISGVQTVTTCTTAVSNELSHDSHAAKTTEPTHTHTISSDNHEPPHQEIFFIKRTS